MELDRLRGVADEASLRLPASRHAPPVAPADAE
jgi:hypothetical protein